MAAPKGNQFWKLRSSHGRDKLFASPDLLLQACEEYFNWVDGHPFYKVEAIKGGDRAGDLIKIPTMRPYTIQGLCRYLNCNSVWFNHFEKAISNKTDEESQGFSKIITHVREAIYQQKFDGAAIGVFNANIIARDLGLKEKAEFTGKDDEPLYPEGGTIDVSKLSPEALRSLYAAIKKP
jgi:hypothetical protein